MAVPDTAKIFRQSMDPTDVLDFYIGLSKGEDDDDLQTTENVTGFTLVLPAESVAAGLQIVSEGRYVTRYENQVFAFWLRTNAAAQINAIFDGTGLNLPVVVTYTTDFDPPRTIQRTVVVNVRNQ